MSDKTNIVAYLDDATTSITYKPAGSENTPKAKSEFWGRTITTFRLA
jgi:hypothetical protein